MSTDPAALPAETARLALKADIAVIGAGQAGLSSAFHLQNLGFRPGRDCIVFDQASGPGGAWQHRWPSLTLTTVNRVHDLPGMRFDETVETTNGEVASVAVPQYFAAYEKAFDLQVRRPVTASTGTSITPFSSRCSAATAALSIRRRRNSQRRTRTNVTSANIHEAIRMPMIKGSSIMSVASSDRPR